jgi:hypothetical protein
MQNSGRNNPTDAWYFVLAHGFVALNKKCIPQGLDSDIKIAQKSLSAILCAISARVYFFAMVLL